MRSRISGRKALLDQVIARQADFLARWLLVGFIHGVMNTDNISIAAIRALQGVSVPRRS